MKIFSCAQGTTEWLRLRAGIPTASCFDKIMTAGSKDWDGGTKGAPKKSEQAEKYMNHLLAERMLGAPIDGFKSQWMERGSEMEHSAVASYELAHECDTERVGFVTTDDGLIGCSPDRLIIGQPKKGLEAKAPSPAVHVSYLLMAVGASLEYKVQLQGQIWLCEWDSVDIISFHPGMPDAVFTVNRDEAFIAELSAHVRAFSARLEETAEDFKVRGWIKEPSSEQPAPDPFGITDDDVDALMADRFPGQAA